MTGTTGTTGVTGTTGTTGVTGTTGTTGVTGTTTTSATLMPYSAIGVLSLDGAGNFTISGFTFNDGASKAISQSGTYTQNANCSFNLSFTRLPTGSTAPPNPVSFTGLLGASNGVITVQPTAGQNVTGLIISQGPSDQ